MTPSQIIRHLGSLVARGPAFALLLLACTSGAALAESRDVTVSIENFTFVPAEITISPGTTVTWINHDDIPHTAVSSEKGVFRSKVMDTDEQFSFTFASAGDFAYFCSLHAHMTGRVIVTPDAK